MDQRLIGCEGVRWVKDESRVMPRSLNSTSVWIVGKTQEEEAGRAGARWLGYQSSRGQARETDLQAKMYNATIAY